MRFSILCILILFITACDKQGETPPEAEETPVVEAATNNAETEETAAGPAAEAKDEAEDEEPIAGEIPKRGEPLPDLITGAQPDQEAIGKFADEGISTVINLRMPGEFEEFDERKAVEAAGLTYTSIPIDKETGLTRENAERVHQALENVSEGKVLLHCGTSNRTGAMLALSAYWFGEKDADEALELGKKAGLTKLEPPRRRKNNARGVECTSAPREFAASISLSPSLDDALASPRLRRRRPRSGVSREET